MEALLDVKNMTKVFQRYGQADFRAVDQMSFSLFPQETLGIVGASGSGKSTVAKAITRLIDISDGHIFFNKKDISHIKGRELRDLYRNIQMVFQSPMSSFDPRCTLGVSVGESLRNAGVSLQETRGRVAELFEQCGLSADLAQRYPYEVSGGQCQRAAIARALAMRPQILICDEITSALDVTVQAQIISLLKNLQKEYGIAYLFICHNLALVQLFCHRVLVMNEGRIVEEGSPDDVIMHPKCDYTKQLIHAVL